MLYGDYIDLDAGLKSNGSNNSLTGRRPWQGRKGRSRGERSRAAAFRTEIEPVRAARPRAQDASPARGEDRMGVSTQPEVSVGSLAHPAPQPAVLETLDVRLVLSVLGNTVAGGLFLGALLLAPHWLALALDLL